MLALSSREIGGIGAIFTTDARTLVLPRVYASRLLKDCAASTDVSTVMARINDVDTPCVDVRDLVRSLVDVLARGRRGRAQLVLSALASVGLLRSHEASRQ